MKKWLLLLSFSLFGCNIADMFTADEKVTYEQLLSDEARAKAAVETAEAAVDAAPEDPKARADLNEAEAELDRIGERIAAMEIEVVKERYGPVWGTLTELPVVGGYLRTFGPFAGALLLPLVSKRGRRHYANAVKNLTPWIPDAHGDKGIAAGDAILDVGKALGMAHSTPASAVAAEKTMPEPAKVKVPSKPNPLRRAPAKRRPKTAKRRAA